MDLFFSRPLAGWLLFSIFAETRAFRKITVGEQFYALFLPEKLKYDHENGITPRYFKIILKPLPYDEQTYLKEIERIESMYGN